MIHLRCLVGIHRTIWAPVTTGPNASWAPPIRKCRDCGRELGRTHRE